MNCSSIRDHLPDLLDPRTPAGTHAEVRAHLTACSDCQREFASLAQTLTALDQLRPPAPTPALRQNFYAMLEAEKNSAPSVATAASRSRPAAGSSLWRWILSPAAGVALLAIGFTFGMRYAPPAAPAAADPATKRELAELRTKIESVGQLASFSLLQQRSTAERLSGVLATLDLKNPTPQLLSNLVGALALDPSVNVRLAALDALYPHSDQSLVRAGVRASLPREADARVQVAMIDFISAVRDREAAPDLERLVRNETLDRVVRDSAKRALAQL